MVKEKSEVKAKRLEIKEKHNNNNDNNNNNNDNNIEATVAKKCSVNSYNSNGGANTFQSNFVVRKNHLYL